MSKKREMHRLVRVYSWVAAIGGALFILGLAFAIVLHALPVGGGLIAVGIATGASALLGRRRVDRLGPWN